jgi:DNA-binding NtrC family response regulator
MERPLALVVNEDAGVRAHVRSALIESGVALLDAATAGEALEVLRQQWVRVLLLTSSPSAAERRGFLEKAARLRPSIATVILVDPPSAAAGADGFRDGAFHVPSRTPDPDRLRLALNGALALHDLLEERRRLRERPDGVEALARRFVEEIRAINALPPIEIAPDAMEALRRHAWQEDVLDLREAMERAVVLAEGGTIRLGDLPDAVRASASAGESPDGAALRFREAKRRVVDSFERRYLSGLLARHRGNVTAAAHHAGMLRSALQRLLRKYDLRSSDFRSPRDGPALD